MYSELMEIIPDSCIKYNEPMKNHTSFKIGGPVEVLVEADNINNIQKVLEWARVKQLPLLVFGQGSNLLVKDQGLKGIAIKLSNNFNKATVNNTEIIAEAGIRLSALAKLAAKHSLTKLEFAEGIPGSLGGAVVMNAGAYDGEIKNVLKSVTAINMDGFMRTFTIEEMDLAYRHSVFQKNNYYVLSALLSLEKGKEKEIKAKMQQFARNRREKQPLEYPSAGSTFKRPTGHYVGPMIEELGLKGFSIGGAQISIKHAGFIINKGNATAQDVLDLIAYIQNKVYEQYGINLEPELRIVGE
ncbi:MAG: UDP-N-acetylmuramate dehydrogenase [Syntrophomonadaceae bacterium]|nr:UDP-N-acetylmuramate dehydrogenase [Syntrophomonadaceae bacterium]